jgi:hypothetical protein
MTHFGLPLVKECFEAVLRATVCAQHLIGPRSACVAIQSRQGVSSQLKVELARIIYRPAHRMYIDNLPCKVKITPITGHQGLRGGVEL